MSSSSTTALRKGVWRIPATAGVVVVAAATGVAAARGVQAASLSVAAGAVVFGLVAVWLFLNERLGWAAIVVGLYLALLDGFLKLKTGNGQVTLARDALIFAVALGYIARASIRRQPLRLPPLGLWIVAYVVVVVIQLANPGAYSVSHSLSALKPDLEFVPLFFLGYAVLQSPKGLRVFVVLLLVCAFANGVVSFVQTNLSVDQLAGWGPGYASKVLGTGDVSGRVYTDESGIARTRPFGLGGDAGAGALIGVVSVGAAMAVLLLVAQRRFPPWALLLCIGPPLALVTGQGRTALVAGIVAALVFTSLAVTVRRLIPSLAAVLLAMALVAGVVSFVGDSSSGGVFDRYKTIGPGSLLATTQDSRGGSISRIPSYAADHPLGAGLGYVGPAASRLPATTLTERGGDGETSFSYFIFELGLPGLLLLVAFNVRLLGGAYASLRRFDPETRTLVAAVAAGLAGIATMWVSAAPLATSPTAPFFWFAAGGLAFWVSHPDLPAAGAVNARPQQLPSERR